MLAEGMGMAGLSLAPPASLKEKAFRGRRRETRLSSTGQQRLDM